MPVMFACFVCSLLVFFAHKFPAKYEKKPWTLIFDQRLYGWTWLQVYRELHCKIGFAKNYSREAQLKNLYQLCQGKKLVWICLRTLLDLKKSHKKQHKKVSFDYCLFLRNIPRCNQNVNEKMNSSTIYEIIKSRDRKCQTDKITTLPLGCKASLNPVIRRVSWRRNKIKGLSLAKEKPQRIEKVVWESVDRIS